MNQPFRFKQFLVHDHLSTMKVGTDSVLLGAWARPPAIGRMLDLGTGCGILALMIAQKTEGHIVAIDIHAPSVAQAHENFMQSPWPDRIMALQSSHEEYSKNNKQVFDYIVSNPPFFMNSLKPVLENRLLARHARPDFIDLFVQSIRNLLTPDGKAAFIIPVQTFTMIGHKLSMIGMPLLRRALVYAKPDIPPTRVLVETGKYNTGSMQEEDIIIYDHNQQYTSAYKKLTQEYYLFLND